MILLLVAALAFALVGIFWAVGLDRADDIEAAREWHLTHGPNDGCVDCEDK